MVNIASVGCGLWVIISKRPFSALFEPKLFVDVAFLLFFLSFIGAVVNAVGFYVTQRELRCFMYIFSVSCLVLSLMLLLAGLMGFIFQKQLKLNALDLQILTALRSLYGQPPDQAITVALDMLQEQFRCCGVDELPGGANFTIWRSSKWHMNQPANNRLLVPLSCCVRIGQKYVNSSACQQTDLKNPDPTYIYTQGCYRRFENHIMQVAFVEGILGMLASASLIKPALFCALLARLTQK
ncbi:tetraspanin family protein [Trichuris trichiura]|uniref:Tetraspanin family protein n=1 Tax=Trichuris trichiura TaxID=36087 RepID=A0A077Z295_TRITR|nr:tetraspanin family protein [Trichuris trichiura]